MQKSFAFDIGTNSIGWCVLELDTLNDPTRIIDAGVRIFSDGREPKSGTSLAEGRRLARSMSRGNDRYKRRRKAVIRTLVEFGLIPADKAGQKALVAETNDKRADQVATDVYALRARALDEKLPLRHIGRVLFHLNQRRGFKSNRKTDKRDNDQGKIASGIAALETKLAGQSLGQYLHQQRLDGKWVRVRPSRVPGKDGRDEDGYGFYPERRMLQDEFNAIWTAQAAHYPDILTEERRAHLETIIFYQRPLKAPKIGKCSFNPHEERLPRAHPLFQEFRLYKEVNELALVDRFQRSQKLTLEQRDGLVTQLKAQREANFSALRKTARAPTGTRFNKETESRIKMKGDEVAAELSSKTRFGQSWFSMPLEERWAIINTLRTIEDPLELTAWLEQNYAMPPERIDAILGARLPEGYGRLGETALTEMLAYLKHEVIPEAEAAERAGYDHALLARGEGFDSLPKYQEVIARRIPPGSEAPDDPYDVRKGRITNPTVHIGLNQLRRVLNALIRRYGKPHQIAIELARDLKLNEEQKREKNIEIARNTRAAEQRSAKLVELGVPDTGYNRVLLKLWEDLDQRAPENRVCTYCGRPINIETLFSSKVDIDHILPWSKSLDDSQANRIVCHVACNRQKGNHAPADVPQWQARYDDILERANRLPLNKRWRFGREAMKKFADEETFLARQLTDTQYLSRLAHEYMAALYPDEEPDARGELARRNHVRVITGRMTEMLRRQWGLNSILADHNQKNRNDHRHHAIDAAVVGVTTRSRLQRIATVAGSREALALEETIGKIEPPWSGFRDDLKTAIDRIVVSHKPDHGTLPRPGNMGQTAGQLHNDTAYGLTGQTDARGTPVVVRRKPFMSLTEKDIPAIRDMRLASALQGAIAGLSGKDLATALDRFRDRDDYKGIRHVRVTEVLNVIPVRDSEGRAYKAYKGDANYRYDVWELPNGKWVEEILSMFDAHQPGWRSKVHAENPAARRVLSLHQNDMVAYEHPQDGLVIGRVVKFTAGKVSFAGNGHGGALKARDADPNDSFKYFAKSAGAMKAAKIRQVRVDEIGQLFDPGPQDRESRAERRGGSTH
ncbi:type II CRISPR RNA-guided endonuclease Cas9 [Devosia faecipullorum]|uniref:type II CRISPR RNA-guided endonuclease Cas9 n=1 Tax=Devosia faecipullorum TaxID=2755039 RepID=UPI00187B7459|nr:type II CRISPR RNA-guided endonuclease Cas9 [Devosia faecipullorum]MBE7734537.1 type II CRISPR RNA-guided endonuclease Cas9 [Devosia faecipullorum]